MVLQMYSIISQIKIILKNPSVEIPILMAIKKKWWTAGFEKNLDTIFNLHTLNHGKQTQRSSQVQSLATNKTLFFSLSQKQLVRTQFIKLPYKSAGTLCRQAIAF